jgi:GMP synthase-like glutamine amidotransferase
MMVNTTPHKLFVVYEDDPVDMGQIEYVLRCNNCEWDEHCRIGGAKAQFDARVHSGLILLGGEGEAPHEQQWIREARANGKAILGICQGAQNLARAAGGEWQKVRPDEGLVPLSLTAEGSRDSLLRHLVGKPQMCQWHSWSCTLPSCAINLAESSSSGVRHSDAFRLDERTYGLQFHPEIPSTKIPDWVKSASKPGRIECLQVARVGWAILDTWVKLAISAG